MKINTRLFFKFLLRRCDVDYVLDIGSCDGYESSLFRQIRPDAKIIAFEANPFLYKKMVDNPNLANNNIEVLPFAISDKNGSAHFHVTDVNYDSADVENPGTSSLLLHEGLKVRNVVEVQTRRIDDFILSEHARARNIALWIDAEGVEFEVLEGMAKIRDRVVGVHVETARTAMRKGQKIYSEVIVLMRDLGFILVGDNMFRKSVWGDAVFIRRELVPGLGFRYHLCVWVGWLSFLGRVNLIGMILRKYCNPLYRFLSKLYLKLFS